MEVNRINEESVNMLKIEFNDAENYIVISADDPTLFDRFAAGFKKISDMADKTPKMLEEIEKNYKGKDDFNDVMEKTIAMSKVNVDFSKEAVTVVDGIFGEGTIRKYFANVYKEIPEFLPDADCIIGFFEKITPTMEKAFDRKLERRKARMAKYQPQDHNRPASKATKADKK